MYGNKTLPGIAVSDTLRNVNSIWRGATEATWFKIVDVDGSGEEAVAISNGSIMKLDTSTGHYAVLAESDLDSLSELKLTIVADYTAQSGTTTGTEPDTETTQSKVLIGVCGQVDKAQLSIGDKLFGELTEAQQLALTIQLEACNFLLVNVIQG